MGYDKKWYQEYYKKNKDQISLKNKEKYWNSHTKKQRSFTEEEFQERIKEHYGIKIKTLTEYINSKTKIKVKCMICDNEWGTQAKNLLQGRGCKKCSDLKKTKSHDKFIEEVSEIFGDKINIISKYESANKQIKLKCNDCDNEWETKASHLIHEKSGCPKCVAIERGFKSRKSHEEFVLEMKHLNKDYEVIGNYETATKKIEIKCKVCDNSWKSIPNSLLRGVGCPYCNHSKGEKKISTFLNENNITHETQFSFSDCKDKQVLFFDFFIKDLNICIEYDGMQHFKAIKFFGGEKKLKDTKRRDKIKNDYCKDNNIKLIRIPYQQYKIIEEILRNNLNIKKYDTI